MRKKFYECIIYTFIRGYINKNYNYYQPYILDCKRGFDEYNMWKKMNWKNNRVRDKKS